MEWKKGQELCFKVIQMAQDLGVQQCDVILQRGRSLSLNAQNNRIDKSKVTSTQVIGIRAIQDQKTGIAASESLDESALRLLVKQALETSRYSGTDSYQMIEQKNNRDMIEVLPELNQNDHATMQEKV